MNYKTDEQGREGKKIGVITYMILKASAGGLVGRGSGDEAKCAEDTNRKAMVFHMIKNNTICVIRPSEA